MLSIRKCVANRGLNRPPLGPNYPWRELRMTEVSVSNDVLNESRNEKSNM